MPNLRNGSKGGFEPGLTRLRVRHSTTELPRSTLPLKKKKISFSQNSNFCDAHTHTLRVHTTI